MRNQPRIIIHRPSAILAILITMLTAGAGAGAAERSDPGLLCEMFGGSTLAGKGERFIMLDLDAMDSKMTDWGLRFKALITAPLAGEYAFRVEADTGVRLKIADQTIIDGWALDGVRTGRAVLSKGQGIPLVIEYFFDRHKAGRKAALRLFWTPPGGKEEVVPADAYRLEPATASMILVRGHEQRQVNLKLPDGGLKPLVGVHNVQIFRATRAKPDLADGDGYTYAHHQDLAVWKGRLYAAWAMTPKDEDVPPYKVVYATSTDGFRWSAPADLFPRDCAWACRFYFYRAKNGRMLAFGAGKSADGLVSEAAKKVLLVREMLADHTLGKVFTLVTPLPDQPPSFETAEDPGFLAACREAADNSLLLEQQDYGRFLGDRLMPWHQNAPSSGGWPFGKALCFYHRKDGVLVGVCKMGFVTLSEDGGKTWAKPEIPPTLVAGGGKVWGQRTADGRYAMAYNPIHAINPRWPLVLIHGDDGHEFKDMRVVHGELPGLRYPGKYKDLGAQYMRGLAEWADDGTFAATKQAMWLVYSVNKEDIWVSRIPLPVKPDETVFPADNFEKFAPSAVVPGWNIYSPRWAPVAVVAEGGKHNLELRDGDPYDYARTVRVFPESKKVRVELALKPAQTNGRLEIELYDAIGRRPVRVALTETGLIQAQNGERVSEIGKYTANETLTLMLAADLAANIYTVQVNQAPAQRLAVAEAGCLNVQRLSLRTGPWRGIGAGEAVDPATDIPAAKPAVFRIKQVSIN